MHWTCNILCRPMLGNANVSSLVSLCMLDVSTHDEPPFRKRTKPVIVRFGQWMLYGCDPCKPIQIDDLNSTPCECSGLCLNRGSHLLESFLEETFRFLWVVVWQLHNNKRFLTERGHCAVEELCRPTLSPLSTRFNSLFPSNEPAVGHVLNRYHAAAGAANTDAILDIAANMRAAISVPTRAVPI